MLNAINVRIKYWPLIMSRGLLFYTIEPWATQVAITICYSGIEM